MNENGVSAASGTEQTEHLTSPTTSSSPVPITVTTQAPAPTTVSTTLPVAIPPTTTTSGPTPVTAPSSGDVSDRLLYLSSPGSGDVASQLVLPLSDESPPALDVVPNYDTDRDHEPGLTLERGSSSQRFRWDIAHAVELRGAVAVQLHATAADNRGPFTLDVALRSCRASVCTDIASRRESTISPSQGFSAITFDLGVVDLTVGAGDAIELVIAAPAESGGDVWLAYDATVAPSRFVYART
jgi:hypothetical protein